MEGGRVTKTRYSEGKYACEIKLLEPASCMICNCKCSVRVIMTFISKSKLKYLYLFELSSFTNKSYCAAVHRLTPEFLFVFLPLLYIHYYFTFINEGLAYKKIVNCTNKSHTIHLGEYLVKVKHKWESRVRKE
jgi:hypothetical protein